MAAYTDEDLERMLAKCITYNKEIAEQQKSESFKYQGANASDTEYQSLPVPDSATIGYVYIPKLGLDLPIMHGTAESSLQNSTGHLYGTSLPVEGDSVHSVIAGHSALASAELFTHIDELEEGDEFYITVLNRRYKYVVDHTTVCLPQDDWQYEQVEDGENMVSLYTCTPYGINSHRLLVAGKLTEAETVERSGPFTLSFLRQTIIYAMELALMLLVPFLTILIIDLVKENLIDPRKNTDRTISIINDALNNQRRL